VDASKQGKPMLRRKVPQRSKNYRPDCKIRFCIVQFIGTENFSSAPWARRIDRRAARKLICVSVKRRMSR
jgi:hypothetical protein